MNYQFNQIKNVPGSKTDGNAYPAVQPKRYTNPIRHKSPPFNISAVYKSAAEKASEIRRHVGGGSVLRLLWKHNNVPGVPARKFYLRWQVGFLL